MSEVDSESDVYVLIDDDCDVTGATVIAAANPDERVLASLLLVAMSRLIKGTAGRRAIRLL